MAFTSKNGTVDPVEKIDYSDFNTPLLNGYPDNESQEYFLKEVAGRMNTLIQSGDSLIDYGCGTGELSNYFADDVQYYGIDGIPFKINMANEINAAPHRTFANRLWTNSAFGTYVDPNTKSTLGICVNGLTVASEIEGDPLHALEVCIETMLRCSEKGIFILAPLSDTTESYIDSGSKVRYSGRDVISVAHAAYSKLYNNTAFHHMSYEGINDGEVFILFIQKQI